MFLDKYRSVNKSKEKDKEKLPGNIKISRKKTAKKTCRKNSPLIQQQQELGDDSQKADVRTTVQQKRIDLIRRCASENATRLDWKEFQEEFALLINSRVEKALLRSGIRKEAITDEIADEIDLAISLKLADKRAMQRIAGYENSVGGLLRAIDNLVGSWGREQDEQSNAHNIYINRSLIRLNMPLGEEEDDGSLIDVIPDPETNPLSSPQEDAVSEIMIQCIRHVESMTDTLKQLAFKTYLMFYKPLSDADIEQIAVLRNITPVRVEKEVDEIMARLAEENDEIEKSYNNIANKFTELQGAIAQLAEKKKDFNTPNSELKRLAHEIAQKTTQHQRLIKRNQKVSVHPEIEEIAKLLKIRKEKKKDISVWLNRFRKKITTFKMT